MAVLLDREATCSEDFYSTLPWTGVIKIGVLFKSDILLKRGRFTNIRGGSYSQNVYFLKSYPS
jgi:hypothetical protein